MAEISAAPACRCQVTSAVVVRLGTTSFAMRICTVSSRWLRVSLRTRIMPRSGRERDGFTSSISLTTLRASPGRVGLGQLISPPLPMIPPPSGRQAGLDE